RRWWRF
nr:Chain A, c-RW [synthetic construct]1QVL_A Chain A, c-RW [synthetic construct]